TFDGETRGHVLERDVRSDARIPEPVEYVEFAGRRFQAGDLGGERDLVVILGARQPHGLLVERREADGIRLPVARQRERATVILQRECAAGLAGDTTLDDCGIKMAK